MSARPNILYVFTDQQTATAMSCAGNRDLCTPNMDRLAREGVRFERAYCTYPLCTPARASMFTGRMPHEIGVSDNGQRMNEEARVNSLGNLLSAGGYDCAYGGKWHIPTVRFKKAERYGFQCIHGFDDNTLADACIEFLRRKREKPFFLIASYDNPHNICEWARDQRLPWGPIPEPESIEACPNLPADFNPPPFEPGCIRPEQRANPKAYAAADFSPEQWRRFRHAYYRLVEKVDAEIGRLLDGLRDTGQEEETLVIFSSDHGDCNGAHGWNQKTVLYEESVRVPLVIRAPGAENQGRIVADRLVSSGLDLLPTLCDYGRVNPPAGLAGHSLRPLLEGRSPTAWRDHLVIETCFGSPAGLGTTARAVLTLQHKYALYSWGRHREQLSDLYADAGEMVNLAVESRHAGTLNAMRKRLYQWCVTTGDTFGEHYSHKGVCNIPGSQ